MNYKEIKNNRFFFSLTMVIVVVTSIVTLFQFAHPEVLSILRRDPESLASGEWWRMITPLLVHADGWGQYIFNVACIVIIGSEVERLYGKVHLLVLYLAGGLIGEVAGYAWEPYGAGASVGLCGLLGGFYVILIGRKKVSNPLFAMLGLYIVVGLIGFASGKVNVFIGLSVTVAVLVPIIMKQKDSERLLGIISGLGGFIGALTLLVMHDIHGAAISGGTFTVVILFLIQRIHNSEA